MNRDHISVMQRAIASPKTNNAFALEAFDRVISSVFIPPYAPVLDRPDPSPRLICLHPHLLIPFQACDRAERLMGIHVTIWC